jgi:CheY-like chemotaxis protein
MARILVVDDEPLVRELLSTVLADAGHDTSSCANGEEGLTRLRAERYAIAIVDRNMPRMSGLEMLAEMRRDESLKGVKVIVCTGAGMLADAEDAIQAGADDYVVKPLEIARLLEKVDKLAAKAAAEPPPPPKPGAGLMGTLGSLFRPKP